MKTHAFRVLAARAALVLGLGGLGGLGADAPVMAGGLPVIDTVNLQQNVVSAVEGVNQTLKMIQQYQLQLQQYENMIQNTLAPAAYVWNKVEQVNMALLGAVNTLNYYKNQAGNLDGYLYKYQNTAYYMSSPCFGVNGCSDTEKNRLFANRQLSSDAQKRANDAMIRGLDLQQQELEADARGRAHSRKVRHAIGEGEGGKMKSDNSVILYIVTAILFAMMAGCDNYVPAKREKISNPTCEDLGKITDDAEHKALLAKCPGYLPGGRKKSQDKEW